jgi:hypothetical protein
MAAGAGTSAPPEFDRCSAAAGFVQYFPATYFESMARAGLLESRHDDVRVSSPLAAISGRGQRPTARRPQFVPGIVFPQHGSRSLMEKEHQR